MFSAKQGNYWYHFYKVFGMMWSLNPGPPALEASTLPLGYRVGSVYMHYETAYILKGTIIVLSHLIYLII